jgi:ribonuclease VapC
VIVDSSALVAIIKQEPDAQEIAMLIAEASSARLSAATLVEASIVLPRDLHGDLDDLIRSGDMEIVAFDADHARAARDAHVRFGKRSGSPAKLNFGDCMTYGLAKVSGEPLLFKGDGFPHTDVTPAR